MDLIVIADAIETLDPGVDTTLGLMAAAQRRGHRVRHCRADQLALRDGRAVAQLSTAAGCRGPRWTALEDGDVVLFRTDPPVDRAYLDATLILDAVDRSSTLVVNDPRGIRVANEKLWALSHPDLCPPTLVAADASLINAFVDEHQHCVVKPIDGHAGRGVLRLDADDRNRASIVEIVTQQGRRPVVVQRWLEAVSSGNKRIFVHGGRPAGAVLRFPAGGDFRIGTPAAVATLTSRDVEICERLAPGLVALGLTMVGLDVIDDWLIEVNVTSPGALRKADRLLGTTLCDDFIDLLHHTTREKGTP